MDELGYLREGLCDQGISVKRSRYLSSSLYRAFLTVKVDPAWLTRWG
jgi:hypothetical protein